MGPAALLRLRFLALACSTSQAPIPVAVADAGATHGDAPCSKWLQHPRNRRSVYMCGRGTAPIQSIAV